jgi:hypothetical protein
MSTQNCHWYVATHGDTERLAHFCATLKSTTIFGEEDSKNAMAFCCGQRVSRPVERWYGIELPRKEQPKFRTPLSAMRVAL